MIKEIQTIVLGISFFLPFAWALTYVFSGQFKQKSKSYLILLLISASFTYLMTYFKFQHHIDLYTLLFPLQTGIVLTLFPLMYMYIKSMTSQKNIGKTTKIFHMAFPLIIFTIFIIYQKVLILSEHEELFVRYLLDQNVPKEDYFNNGKIIYNVGKLILVLTSLLYTVAIIITLKKYYKEIKEIFSQNDTTELSWLKGLGLNFIVIVIFFTIIHILNNKQVMDNSILVIISYLMFACFFWYLGLNGFRQKEIFNSSKTIDLKEIKDAVKISKNQLCDYLEKTKPYINPDITAFDFCYHFHTNRTYLSESIRKNFNQNFRGLINIYRVKEAQKLIEESLLKKGFSDLDEIAKESGFSSYTTFFRVFKSEIGISPSDYSKKLSSSK